MTHVVKIDIITGHEEKGDLHLCSFSKFVQLIMKV